MGYFDDVLNIARMKGAPEVAKQQREDQLHQQELQEAKAKEMADNDPLSEGSKQAQAAFKNVMTTLGKSYGVPIPADMDVSGLSRAAIKNIKLDDVTKTLYDAKAKAAQEDQKFEHEKVLKGMELESKKVDTDRQNKGERRRTNTEIRNTAMKIAQQALPEMRKLNESIRAADSLADQADMAMINPIAKGSLGFLAARTAGSNSQLSDKEREVFIRAGGLPTKAQQALADLQSGTLIPGMSKNYKAWLKVLRARAHNQVKQMKEESKRRMRSLYEPEELQDFNMDEFFDPEFNNQQNSVPLVNNSTQQPAPGSVQGGYRFRGGNPADKNNWEPVK